MSCIFLHLLQILDQTWKHLFKKKENVYIIHKQESYDTSIITQGVHFDIPLLDNQTKNTKYKIAERVRMDIPNTCECLYYLESTLTLLPTCSFRLVVPNFSSQKNTKFSACKSVYLLWCSLCLNYFHLLAWNPNLEFFFIYSNKFFHNFHSSESSFTCTRLDGIGLAWRLMMRNRGPCNITRIFTIAHAQFAIINLFV